MIIVFSKYEKKELNIILFCAVLWILWLHNFLFMYYWDYLLNYWASKVTIIYYTKSHRTKIEATDFNQMGVLKDSVTKTLIMTGKVDIFHATPTLSTSQNHLAKVKAKRCIYSYSTTYDHFHLELYYSDL